MKWIQAAWQGMTSDTGRIVLVVVVVVGVCFLVWLGYGAQLMAWAGQ